MKVRLLVRFELREFTFSDSYMGRAQFRVRAVEGSTWAAFTRKECVQFLAFRTVWCCRGKVNLMLRLSSC